MENNISLCKLFVGVKKINGHIGVNFSFKVKRKEKNLDGLVKNITCIEITNFEHTKLYSFQNLSLGFILKIFPQYSYKMKKNLIEKRSHFTTETHVGDAHRNSLSIMLHFERVLDSVCLLDFVGSSCVMRYRYQGSILKMT